MNLGLLGFFQGLLQQRLRDEQQLEKLKQRELERQQIFNIWKQERDYLQQQTERQRQQTLQKLLGSPAEVPALTQQTEEPIYKKLTQNVSLSQPKTQTQQLAGAMSKPAFEGYRLADIGKKTEYTGGLLSNLINQNPMLRDVIAARVYGLNIPMPQPKYFTSNGDIIEVLRGKTRKIYEAPKKAPKPVGKIIKTVGNTIVSFDPITGKPVYRETFESVKQKGKTTVYQTKAYTDGKGWFFDEVYVAPDGREIRRIRHKTFAPRTAQTKQTDKVKLYQRAAKLLEYENGWKMVNDPLAGGIVIYDMNTNQKIDPRIYQQALQDKVRELQGGGMLPQQTTVRKTSSNDPFLEFSKQYNLLGE